MTLATGRRQTLDPDPAAGFSDVRYASLRGSEGPSLNSKQVLACTPGVRQALHGMRGA